MEYLSEKELIEAIHRHSLSFRFNYFGKWIEGTKVCKEERELCELAGEYHQRCDKFDREVCSGISFRTGKPILIGPDQLRLANLYAREVRDEIMTRGRALGFSEERIRRAIKEYRKR